MYSSIKGLRAQATPVIDYRRRFHQGMTAQEILDIDFSDFYKQEESRERRFNEMFWQKDADKARGWAANLLNNFRGHPYSKVQLKEYETLRLRKALFSRLASFRLFMFDDVERLLSSWQKKKLINLTHKERLLKLLSAERLKVSWMMDEANEEIGSAYVLEIIALWDEDKEQLAALLKSNILNQSKLAPIVDHLRFGPERLNIPHAIGKISETMETFGVSVNQESLRTEYFRWQKRSRRKGKRK